MFIGGRWTDASDGRRIDVIDPTTAGTLGTTPAATAQDVDDAVVTAERAQRSWARLDWSVRSAALRELARRVERHAEEFRELDAINAGLSYSGMAKDVTNAVNYLRYYASLASELKGESNPVPGDCISFTVREPYGVVGRIVPFNHPIQFAAQAIGAPLVAGNAVILKPADQTPLSALRLAELAEDLWEPGVLSVVTGDLEAGRAIVTHPRIRRIGFTGSSATAANVMRDAADSVKALSFELGGKNPMIVLPDVDLDDAAGACVQAMNLARCQGQACGSPSRVFVHAGVHDAFLSALVKRVSALTVGDPLDPRVDMGPLAFGDHYRRVVAYVESGSDQGAKLAFGGKRPKDLPHGYFLEPTVFSNVSSEMSIAREEIFGPVISVLKWSELDEVMEKVNALDYGLTANIWTNDVSTALWMARSVQSGYVYINGRGQRPLGAPFGGYGISGFGKENDLSEVLSYTQVKTILIDLKAPGVSHA